MNDSEPVTKNQFFFDDEDAMKFDHQKFEEMLAKQPTGGFDDKNGRPLIKEWFHSWKDENWRPGMFCATYFLSYRKNWDCIREASKIRRMSFIAEGTYMDEPGEWRVTNQGNCKVPYERDRRVNTEEL